MIGLSGSCKPPNLLSDEERIIEHEAPSITQAAAAAAADAATQAITSALLHNQTFTRESVRRMAFDAASGAAAHAASQKAVNAMSDAVHPAQYDILERDVASLIIVVVLILLVWLVKHLSFVLYRRAHNSKQLRRQRAEILFRGFKKSTQRRQAGRPQDLATNLLLPAMGSHCFHGMRPIPKGNQISLSFESLGLSLLSNGKCIMKGVTGDFVPGRLASIMGPSGAGKTTLLNTLCGKASYGKMTGSVFINGRKAKDIQDLRPVMGFVPQDDIVHEDLTPYEQLLYSVRLRNQPGIDGSEVRSIVEDIISIMQLQEVRNTVVGNQETRGISGGQRKRVNIGLELAARPRILFLDEPTSGLDSTTALSIIKSLEQLAKLGMTIVMVVHQPRYSLFELFDDVLLLGKCGHTVYSGPAISAKPYFESLGYAMPHFENPADWLMDVISSDKAQTIPEFTPHALFSSSQSALSSSSHSSLGSCSTKEPEAEEILDSDGSLDNVDMCPEQTRTHISCCTKTSPARSCFKLLSNTSAGDDSNLTEPLTGCMGLPGSASPRKSFTDDKPGSLEQCRILVHRSLVKWWRQSTAHLMGQMFILGSAYVCGETARGQMHASGPKFALDIFTAQVILALLVGVSRSRVFGTDKPLFYRESASGVRVLSVYLAKIIWDTVSIVLESLLFICAWYAASDAEGSLAIFLPSFLLAAFVGAGWGYFLSTFVPPHNSVLATVATIMITGAAISSPAQINSHYGKGFFQDKLLQSSPFTWSVGMCFIRALYETGGCGQGGPCCDIMELAAKEEFSGYWYITAVHHGYDLQQRMCFAVLLMIALVLYIAGYLSLKYTNRDKQV